MASSPRTLELPDLSGTRTLLTGGSDGIGLAIAARLASAGTQLLLPVRNPVKGASAVAEIRRTVPDAQVTLLSLDLSSLASIDRLVAELTDAGEPIHHMINNAGVMTPPSRQLTADGFELQWGTNHLGHVALVLGILPLLRAGSARVTSQVSVAANERSIQWDDLNFEHRYNGRTAYSQSKIALGLFGLELDRRSRIERWGITSNLSHPGVAPTSLLAARTELGRAEPVRGRRFIEALSRRGILFGTVRSAAEPALLAATAPDGAGRMYGPSGLAHLGGPAAEQALYSRLRSEAEAARVWETSAELIDAARRRGRTNPAS